MNFLGLIMPRRKALRLSSREMECIEDGLLWGLNCLSRVLPSPIGRWVEERQRRLCTVQDLLAYRHIPFAETIWSRLGLADTLGPAEPQTPLNAGLRVGARLMVLADHRPPVWWAGTAKAPQMLALIVGLGCLFTPNAAEPVRPLGAPELLTTVELGYALSLIAEYSGTEPKEILKSPHPDLREGFFGGKALLNRDLDLREDLYILTNDYDRQHKRW